MTQSLQQLLGKHQPGLTPPCAQQSQWPAWPL